MFVGEILKVYKKSKYVSILVIMVLGMLQIVTIFFYLKKIY